LNIEPVPQRLTFTATDGISLVGDRWLPAGRSRGTIVFLHGGGQNRHSWTRTARNLASQGWDCLTFDARGHGESEWSPSGSYMLTDFVDDLRVIVESLDDPPTLVGASLGGRVVLATEGEHPGTAHGLVLVDIAHRVAREGQDRVLAFMRGGPDGFASLADAGAAVASYRPNGRPIDLERLRRHLRRGKDGRWYWHWDPAFLTFGDNARNFDPNRLTAAARSLRLPVLLVRGRHSDVVSPDDAAEFLRLVPTARLVEVSAGHMIVGDENSVFAKELRRFMEADVESAHTR
jgi:pimeloyl-ACP methyl ester carboxylesterase